MGGTNTFIYDQQSYQLPIGTLPEKGGNVWATFKLISKGGEKYTIHTVTRFIINSEGEAEVISNKEIIDCND
jgi:predicted oxidoreductase